MNQQIIDWKNYLKSHTNYSGDASTDDMDDDFKNSMIQLESSLSKDVPDISGLIWLQNTNTLNPNVSVQDFEEASKLLSEKNKTPIEESANPIQTFAQATMDAMGPPDNSCLLGSFMISSDKSSQNDDPDNPNAIAVMDSTVPKKLPEDVEKPNSKNKIQNFSKTIK
jgi:hypothetical protein